ncbi:integrase, partial [Providencia rettgeri]|nr:integrase [Providencia rettgeri]
MSLEQGRLVGQKAPLNLKEICAIRIRLQLSEKVRDLALFNLAIDSKLRGCDLVSLRVFDISQGKIIYPRAIVMQRKTHRPVQFEINESPHLSTRQYARIVDGWVKSIGLDPVTYGTHTMRRTKAKLIYRRTKNLRAVQLSLGHTKLEST